MDPVSEQMKVISGGLDQAVKAGRELDRSIKNVNNYMNEEVGNQAHIRAQQRKRERMAEINREELARLRLDEKKNIERRKAELRNDIVRTYGKESLSLFSQCVSEIKKEQELEKKDQDKDKEKINELKWLCFLAALVVTIFLSNAGLI